MLTPGFSPEGSNNIRHEKVVYGQFIKYLREVAGIFNSIYNHRTNCKHLIRLWLRMIKHRWTSQIVQGNTYNSNECDTISLVGF